MKNYKNVQKMMLAFGLLVTLLLPGVGLANAKTLPQSSKVFGNKDEILKYSKLST